eukprot:5221284-Amphidinium_carterae.1
MPLQLGKQESFLQESSTETSTSRKRFTRVILLPQAQYLLRSFLATPKATHVALNHSSSTCGSIHWLYIQHKTYTRNKMSNMLLGATTSDRSEAHEIEAE